MLTLFSSDVKTPFHENPCCSPVLVFALCCECYFHRMSLQMPHLRRVVAKLEQISAIDCG